MPAANLEKDRSGPTLLGRLWRWIDQCTGADRIFRQSLGGARFAYSSDQRFYSFSFRRLLPAPAWLSTTSLLL